MAASDYRALLARDPILQGLLRQLSGAGVENTQGLIGAERQLYGRLGEAPDLNTPYFRSLPQQLQEHLRAVITPELQGIIGQSNQAGLSTLAQLQRQYGQAQSGTIGSLAGRGILHSGALGQHSNENLYNLTLGQYQARQSALDALGQAQQRYLGQQRELAGQAAQGTQEALGRIGQQINAGLIGYGNAPQPSAPHYPSPARFDIPSYKPRPVAAPRPSALRFG